MPITRTKKAEIVKKLDSHLAKAKTVAFVNFHGLSVSAASALRRFLKEKNVGYTVARKTLIARALDGLKPAPVGERPELAGEIALAYGEDQFWPAKGIHEFSKKAGASLQIVGGIFEARYVGAVEMQALAQVPDRETMYGQLVQLLVFPMRRLVMTLDQISKKQS